MEYVGINSLREAYSKALIETGKTNRGVEVSRKKINEPLFEGMAFHPETEISRSYLNDNITEMTIDFVGLNKEIIELSKRYRSIMENIKYRLDEVDKNIAREEDRVRDMNIVCGNYKEFDNVLKITPGRATGVFSSEGDMFYGAVRSSIKTAPLEIIDIQGNGFEENTTFRKNLIDNDILTTWTYKRYSSKDDVKNMSQEVNKDTEQARCTIVIHSKTIFSSIRIQSEDNIVIEDVLASLDNGISYARQMPKEIAINDKDRRYNSPDYVYESGVIAFPPTNYIKLQVRGTPSSEKAKDINGNINTLVNVSRISIDGIVADATTYKNAEIRAKDLITTPVDSIAIFANEYVPPHFVDNEYFEYVLTVNGIDYPVVPINSTKQGTKIIRRGVENSDYVMSIKETIKGAELKVIIKSTDGSSTPYLSNLKICTGRGRL
jgi:hypothetical protein